MKANHLVKTIFKKFSNVEGNQHIANEYALKCILQLIKDFKVRSVLEVGIGIGCIADVILEYSTKINYTATEANEFCLNAIQENVSQIQRVTLYEDLSKVPEGQTFDFIIIDGSDSNLSRVKNMCKSTSIIFIEGDRALQISDLKKIFPQILQAEMISDYKNPSYSPFQHEHWCGGGQLLFPSPSLKMKFYYFKVKVFTYLKRKKRNFKK